jgi:uncharacterized protein (UPF0261 family)
VGEVQGEACNGNADQAKGPVSVVLPLGGVSSIDRPGRIFYLPEANEALFGTLKAKLSSNVNVIEDAHHIDDPEFASLAAKTMIDMLGAHN